MRIGLHVNPTEEQARYARELGVEYVIYGPPGEPSGVLSYEGLARAREYFDAQGLRWDVIENLPPLHYDKVMFGLPGRDEQIANVCQTIRNMGRAGIGVLQYQWMLLGGLRTEYSPTGRGGARYSRFEQAKAERMGPAAMDWFIRRREPVVYPHIPDRPLSAEQVWAHLVYFLERIIPVAEEAGVKVAVHPDDAPIPEFLGVARILVSLEALQRVIDAVPSDYNGLGFCQGTIATMAGVDMIEAIRRFGRQNKIFFAHFRNPRGQVPDFDEVFPDEGDTDMLAAVRAYREVGYDGVVRIDHCPGVIGDTPRADRSYAYQVGYLRGLVRAAEIKEALDVGGEA
jgi:mannonate dehydratase